MKIDNKYQDYFSWYITSLLVFILVCSLRLFGRLRPTINLKLNELFDNYQDWKLTCSASFSQNEQKESCDLVGNRTNGLGVQAVWDLRLMFSYTSKTTNKVYWPGLQMCAVFI